eukprot:g2428.t1
MTAKTGAPCVARCQLGVGRDCAFENNSTQIVASVVLIGVGMLLAIYATCLYRPRSKSSEAIAEEEALAKKHYEALASRLKKTEERWADREPAAIFTFQRPVPPSVKAEAGDVGGSAGR